MSRHVTTRPLADQDLEDLFFWYGTEGGADLAQQFESAVWATFNDLLQEPEIGTPRNYNAVELHGLRKWNVQKPFGKVLIFYLKTDYGIDVVRVLRGERDIDALFSQPPV